MTIRFYQELGPSTILTGFTSGLIFGHAAELIPCLVKFTEGDRHDSTFFKYFNVPQGSYLVMDRVYTDAQSNNRGIFVSTMIKDNARYESIEEIYFPEDMDREIIKDLIFTVYLGYLKSLL